MAISLFKSFRSSVTPFIATGWTSALKLLVDPQTGAPVGIQSQNANGPDGIWTPIDLTAAQIAAPTALMLADLNATYRLSVAPYTRYQSDGTCWWRSAATVPTEQLPRRGPADGASNTPLLTIGAGSYATSIRPSRSRTLPA
jgi:hypothetical protein